MNPNVFKLAIVFVGVTLLVSVIGIIYLATESKPTPDVLQNIAIGALTGIVGLLVSPKDSP